MNIRPYAEGDETRIAALILAIQRTEFGIPITLEAQPDLANIRGFYQTGAGNFWVAEIDGDIVGTVALKDIGNGDAALRKMFVAAGHRGRLPAPQQGGVAQQLLQSLLQWARQKGLSNIYLGTTEKFLAAHRFYEKQGFMAIPRESLPKAFPLMQVDTRFYWLSLQ